MEQQIELARSLGAAGVALGALLPNRRIDRVATARLLGSARPLSVTFHRAIDMTPDPLEGLEVLLRARRGSGAHLGRRGHRARGRAGHPLDGRRGRA